MLIGLVILVATTAAVASETGKRAGHPPLSLSLSVSLYSNFLPQISVSWRVSHFQCSHLSSCSFIVCRYTTRALSLSLPSSSLQDYIGALASVNQQPPARYFSLKFMRSFQTIRRLNFSARLYCSRMRFSIIGGSSLH